jgi:hypothetical protein
MGTAKPTYALSSWFTRDTQLSLNMPPNHQAESYYPMLFSRIRRVMSSALGMGPWHREVVPLHILSIPTSRYYAIFIALSLATQLPVSCSPVWQLVAIWELLVPRQSWQRQRSCSNSNHIEPVPPSPTRSRLGRTCWQKGLW